MKKEEDILLKRCGNRRPFTTPDGYFENLTESIMASLPAVPFEETEKATLWSKAKVWVYMAACFAGMLLVFNFAINTTKDAGSNMQTAEADTEVYSDEYIDSFFETAMIDEYTLYCSLTNTGNFNQL